MTNFNTQEIKELRAELLKKSTMRYKFLDSKYLIDLSQEQTWMSDPAGFNDPYDFNFDIKNLIDRSPFSDDKKLRKAFSEIFRNNSLVNEYWFYDEFFIEVLERWIDGNALPEEVIESFKVRSQEFGVSCFARDWDVPLMWSHYADSHKGICVEYAFNPIRFAIKNLSFAQYHVQYTTDSSPTCFSELLFAPHQVLGKVIASKHAAWSYENEWRLVHFTEKNKYVEMPEHMRISALILGVNFDMQKRDDVFSKASELNVPVYKVVRKAGRDMLKSL